jgi:hypothetical protein
MHCMKASPVCPSGQEQVAVWSLTKHMALRPQTAPKAHGFIHFLSRQALSNGQSVLSTHSGWQLTEGSPSKPSIHVHTARPPNTWQYALAAQGLGWHGSLGGGTAKTYTSFEAEQVSICSQFQKHCNGVILSQLIYMWHAWLFILISYVILYICGNIHLFCKQKTEYGYSVGFVFASTQTLYRFSLNCPY